MSGWRDGKELLRLTKLRCNFFFANATFEIAGLAGQPTLRHGSTIGNNTFLKTLKIFFIPLLPLPALTLSEIK